jgi:ABC-2 type transport system permease protein
MNLPVPIPRLSSPRRSDAFLSWILLRTKFRIRRSQFRTTAERHPGRVAMQLFLVIPSLLAIGVLFFVTMRDVLSAAETDRDATAILGTLLTLTMMAAFIGSTTTALQSLYLSNDLPFLMTLPVPLRVIYADKFVDAMTGAIPGAFFGVVFLAAYATTQSDSVLIVPAALFAEAMVIALATTAAVLVVALVTRSVPPVRARIFLLGISFSLVVVTMTIWTAILPARGMDEGGRRSLAALGNSLEWLPTTWIAQAVAAAARGDSQRAWSEGVRVAVVLGAANVVSYQVFARSFASGIALARTTLIPRQRRALARRLSTIVTVLPQDVGAIVVKEWLTAVRDLKRLSGIIWPMGVVAVYGFGSARRQTSAGDDAIYHFWLANASIALVPWAVSLGLAIFAFGSEGRSVHLLRLIPVSPRRIFLAKVIASAIPVAIVSELAAVVVGTATGGSVGQVVGMMALVAWGSAGFVTIDTAAAAFAPNFEADQVQRSTELVGRGLSIVAGSAFGLASAVAVGRIIFFINGPPHALAGVLSWKLIGSDVLGWPLVLAAVAAALATLLVVSRFAVRCIDDLVRNGP